MEESNPTEIITRIEAARREINAAVIMFLNDQDTIAVHAVAAGGLQIVTDLAAKKNSKVGFEAMLEQIIPERREEFRKLIREPQNFIKHADRPKNHEDTLEFRPGALEPFLFIACTAYNDFTDTMTPEMFGFIFWESTRNPDLLLDKSAFKAQVLKYINQFDPANDTKEEVLLIIKNLRDTQPHSNQKIDYR